MKITVSRKMGVFLAVAFDDEGNEVDSITALSKPNAKQLLEEKLGLKTRKKPLRNQKLSKTKTKTKTKAGNGSSGSVMSGLSCVTLARNWEKLSSMCRQSLNNHGHAATALRASAGRLTLRFGRPCYGR